MAAAGSVISSSKAPLPLPHRIKTSKTNTARKMRHMQQGAEFPGNMPSRSGIDKHKLFDLGFFFFYRCLLILSFWSKEGEGNPHFVAEAYLTGAPLLWAGFSSTVTVLSVWFSEVSWS